VDAKTSGVGEEAAALEAVAVAAGSGVPVGPADGPPQGYKRR
jgi:hypothetical protein